MAYTYWKFFIKKILKKKLWPSTFVPKLFISPAERSTARAKNNQKLQIWCGSSPAMYSIWISLRWSQSETQDLLESEATKKAEDDKEVFPWAGKHVWNAAFIIHVEISEGKDRGETGVLKSSPTGLQRVQKMRAWRGEEISPTLKTEWQRITTLKKNTQGQRNKVQEAYKNVEKKRNLFNLNFLLPQPCAISNPPYFQTAVRQLIRWEEMTSAHFFPCGGTDRRLQRAKSVPYHIFPSPFFSKWLIKQKHLSWQLPTERWGREGRAHFCSACF